MENDEIILGSYHRINVDEVDYNQLPFYIEQAKSFARITASCVFVVDHCKGNIPYASSRLLDKECTDEMMNDSYTYFTTRMLYNEVEKFKEISKASFSFISQLPVEERKLYTMSFGFHLIEKNIKLMMYRHITPLALSSKGNVWLLIGVIATSADLIPGFSVLRRNDNGDYYEYDYNEHKYVQCKEKVLDEVDRKILILASQGYCVDAIATSLYKSSDAIKSRKQKIFHNLGVKTITEAIIKARNLMLF